MKFSLYTVFISPDTVGKPHFIGFPFNWYYEDLPEKAINSYKRINLYLDKIRNIKRNRFFFTNYKNFLIPNNIYIFQTLTICDKKNLEFEKILNSHNFL